MTYSPRNRLQDYYWVHREKKTIPLTSVLCERLRAPLTEFNGVASLQEFAQLQNLNWEPAPSTFSRVSAALCTCSWWAATWFLRFLPFVLLGCAVYHSGEESANPLMMATVFAWLLSFELGRVLQRWPRPSLRPARSVKCRIIPLHYDRLWELPLEAAVIVASLQEKCDSPPASIGFVTFDSQYGWEFLIAQDSVDGKKYIVAMWR